MTKPTEPWMSESESEEQPVSFKFKLLTPDPIALISDILGGAAEQWEKPKVKNLMGAL